MKQIERMLSEKSRFDICRRRFGKLVVVERISGQNSKAMWQCRCDCGTVKNVSYHCLVSGATKSCGCSRAEAKSKDLSGMRFGRLTAIEATGDRQNGCRLWRCRCVCGRETIVTSNALLSGNTKSCGCLSVEVKRAASMDIRGQRFGKLIALAPTEERRNGSVVWQCQCDCGRECRYPLKTLRQGSAKSCGCLKGENDTLQRSLHYVEDTCIEFIDNVRKSNDGEHHRGVDYQHGKWRARITFRKRNYYLGSYVQLTDAMRVRKEAEEALFGGFLEKYYAENHVGRQRK